MNRRSGKMERFHAGVQPLREGQQVGGGDTDGRKVALVHLGCAKNLVDSEAMLGRLLRPGVSLTTDVSDADVIIVNTCSFIDPARRESVNAILDVARQKREGRCERLVVAGCLVERYRADLEREMPEVDAFVAQNDIPRIAEVALEGLSPDPAGEPRYLYDFEAPRVLSTPAGMAYVKIADGCDHECSFCAIPITRGRQRSRSQRSIAREVRHLVEQGTLEINLVAHDTTGYGCDLGLRDGLATLIEELRETPGLRWLRILYLYPTNLGNRVIDLLGDGDPVLPYFDVPLQHAHPSILRSMKRGLGVRRIMDRIRKRVPQAVLRTALIVGYPGEGDGEFDSVCDFVREACFDHLGVFTYSAEEDVRATRLGDPVPEKIKRQRRKTLIQLQRGIALSRNRASIGRTMPCLLLGHDEARGRYWGRLARQAPEVDGLTFAASSRELRIPSIVEVRIKSAGPYDLKARIE